jgi:multidrug efflux pump
MLPLGLVGAVVAVKLRVFPNDVYLQIGLLTTIGLSTKNAILIIQFIKEQMHQGHELVDATLSAVRIRLRPVIMTSLAFFFGTLPLALTKGAGASAQNAIGTAVTGGLLSATFIDLIFIPFFFVLVSRLASRRKDKPHNAEPSAANAPEVHGHETYTADDDYPVHPFGCGTIPERMCNHGSQIRAAGCAGSGHLAQWTVI